MKLVTAQMPVGDDGSLDLVPAAVVSLLLPCQAASVRADRNIRVPLAVRRG
jgi:hypothetical protein